MPQGRLIGSESSLFRRRTYYGHIPQNSAYETILMSCRKLGIKNLAHQLCSDTKYFASASKQNEQNGLEPLQKKLSSFNAWFKISRKDVHDS